MEAIPPGPLGAPSGVDVFPDGACGGYSDTIVSVQLIRWACPGLRTRRQDRESPDGGHRYRLRSQKWNLHRLPRSTKGRACLGGLDAQGLGRSLTSPELLLRAEAHFTSTPAVGYHHVE